MEHGDAREGVYHLDASDPEQRLIDRSEMSPTELAHIGEVMAALGALRAAETRLSEASRAYMKLNETDMRALHYLIVCENSATLVTPGMLAHHLEISTASTTKLLDRLAAAGHVTRSPHPTDRRALTVAITQETREAAMNTVGRQQAKRVYSAARLTPAERDVVIRFLREMAADIELTEEWPTA